MAVDKDAVVRLVQKRIVVVSIALLLVSWFLVFTAVLPIGWYHGSREVTCPSGEKSSLSATYSLWGMRICQLAATQGCEKECEYHSWRDYGCGNTGPYGNFEIDCWELDTAGVSCGFLLITALFFSAIAMALSIVRVVDKDIGPFNKFYIAIMNMVTTITAAMLTIFVWFVYPIVVDKGDFEGDNPMMTIHLYWGWYLVFFSFVIQVFQCCIASYDSYRTGVRNRYEALQEDDL